MNMQLLLPAEFSKIHHSFKPECRTNVFQVQEIEDLIPQSHRRKTTDPAQEEVNTEVKYMREGN